MKIEFNLKPLHFSEDAFAPKLSSESFAFHYHKHHKGYVDNLNKLCDADMIARYDLEKFDLREFELGKFDSANFMDHENQEEALLEIIKRSHQFLIKALASSGENKAIIDFDNQPNLDKKIFNNAAQHWNHAFFWESINPIKQVISSNLAKQIEAKWGSIDEFEKAFYNNGVQLFGSGWVWLVFNKKTDQLEIIKTLNAGTPIISDNLVPLLVCDAWEHAYYIDYRNKRVDYLEQIIPHLNWEFAQKNFDNIK